MIDVRAARIDCKRTRHRSESMAVNIDERCIDRECAAVNVDARCIDRERAAVNIDAGCIDAKENRHSIDERCIDRDCVSINIDARCIDRESTRLSRVSVHIGIDAGDIIFESFTPFMMCGLNDRGAVASCVHAR
jgi:hypothetical protein